jgi:phosphoglycolate phosphatase
MNRDQIKAVVFDFDGTLAETNIDFAKMRERIHALVREWGLWEDDMGENRWVLEVIEHAAGKLDDPEQRAAFEREAAQVLVDVEMATCALAAPYAGVPEALARLRAAGLKIGIVTRNCRACVDHFTERHPLPYDVCLTRDDVEIVKPHPAHLLEALDALGVRPEEALMVGDHRSDIECANAAGSGGIGVYHTGGTAEHFAELGAVASYADVPAFVEDLLGQSDQ